ncbi:MAG: hypothetical protein COA79_15895 [Planctomycetota bacterium]|nr:MAG: hypothetical protein COA79_15895 [Planctomycetota bacterium]
MIKNFITVFFLVSFTACGSSGGSSATVIDIDSLAAAAKLDAPWAGETEGTLDGSNSISISDEIVFAIDVVFSEANTFDAQLGPNVNEVIEINKVITSSKGGSANIKGTLTFTSGADTFPFYQKIDLAIDFSGYTQTSIASSENDISLHGSFTYTGGGTFSSLLSVDIDRIIDGGYSYKDSSGVYNIATKIVTFDSLENAATVNKTRKYTVNGQKYTK